MISSKPLVSVIIVDYKSVNPYRQEAFAALKKQTYTHFEVILVTDYKLSPPPKFPRLKLKSYGRYVGPAQKRDDGATLAKGQILAFLDDDAYPHPDWLKKMVAAYSSPQIAAVGGPGVNPLNISWLEAASGWFSSSPLGAGTYTYRFFPGAKRYVDDYPSMNLSVRREDFFAIGGFDSHYYPGEDTKLCLDLVYKLHKKILYHPQVLVYHHRRPLLIPHLKQNGNYGLHRGFFARILPRTSLYPIYFGPPLMVVGLLYLVSATIFPSLMFPQLFLIGAITSAFYLLLITLNSLWVYSRSHSLLQGLVTFPLTLITHFWYGLRFLQGFFLTKQLTR